MSDKPELEASAVVAGVLGILMTIWCCWFTLQIMGAYYWFPWQWGWWP